MGWLMPLVWRLEASPQVRCHLRVFANSAAYFRSGRVFLHERATADASDEMHEVSLRATRVVKHTLEVARHPITYTDLTAPLLASIPGATEEKVEALLTLLWQQTLLLTDLRPPLTGEAHPASYLQRRLAALPPTTALAEQLAAILKLLFDTLYEKHWMVYSLALKILKRCFSFCVEVIACEKSAVPKRVFQNRSRFLWGKFPCPDSFLVTTKSEEGFSRSSQIAYPIDFSICSDQIALSLLFHNCYWGRTWLTTFASTYGEELDWSDFQANTRHTCCEHVAQADKKRGTKCFRHAFFPFSHFCLQE